MAKPIDRRVYERIQNSNRTKARVIKALRKSGNPNMYAVYAMLIAFRYGLVSLGFLAKGLGIPNGVASRLARAWRDRYVKEIGFTTPEATAKRIAEESYKELSVSIVRRPVPYE